MLFDEPDAWLRVRNPPARTTLMRGGRNGPGAWRFGDGIPWRRRLTGQGFAANVAFMVTGTALGQAASIVLSPVLTRLYTPDQFGYLSVYTAALTIFGVIAVLGFELAIPLAANDTELANLL